MKNKRIMIIGGTGALGKSLTKRLIFDNKAKILHLKGNEQFKDM